MKFEALDVVRVSGNKDKILFEERITDILESVPWQDMTYLMLPGEFWAIDAEEARKRGVVETPPLSRMDMAKRAVLTLTKQEVEKIFKAKPGEEIVLVRKGWDRVWRHKIRKLEE